MQPQSHDLNAASMTPPTTPERLYARPPAAAIGLLIGLAAATPAMAPPIPALPVRPWHLFVLMAFAMAVIFRSRRERSALVRISYLDVSVAAFAALTFVVEFANAGSLDYAMDYMDLARPLFWLAIYRAVCFVIDDEEDARRLLSWFALPAIPSVIIGFGQVLGVEVLQQAIIRLTSDTSGFATRLEDGRLLRATGFVQHWTSFGSYLCTVVAAGGSLLILARAKKVGREGVAWMVLAVAGLGVIATFTLSSILTALFIFLSCSRAAKATSKVVPLVLLIAMAGAVAVGPLFVVRLEQQFATGDIETGIVPSTLQYRYRIWTTETIPMVKERPMTGWGSNVYNVATGNAEARRIYPSQLFWHSPESQWLSLLMSYGWIGLAAFVLIIGTIARMLRKGSRQGLSWIAKPTSTLFILMLIAAFTAPVFMNHGLPVGLWTLTGLLSVFLKRQRFGEHTVTHPSPSPDLDRARI